MATLEEIIRKRKETEGKGNTTTLERILVERNLRTHGNNSKAIKGYNDWIGRVNASRDKYVEDAKSRADVYQPSNLFNSYADTTDAEIKALAQEGQKYREHFLKYGDLYGADMANKIRSGVDDVDSYLHDLSVGLGAERRYWEGFTDLEDFNTKRAAAEAAKKEAEEYAAKKEKYKAYDFAAGERKIAGLEEFATRYNEIQDKIDDIETIIAQEGAKGRQEQKQQAINIKNSYLLELNQLSKEYDEKYGIKPQTQFAANPKTENKYGITLPDPETNLPNLYDFNKLLSEAKAYHSEASDWLAEDALYNVEDPEFDKYVSIGKNADIESVGDIESTTFSAGGSSTIWNEPDLMRRAATALAMHNGKDGGEWKNRVDVQMLLKHMSDDQFDTLAYHIGKDSVDGTNNAEEYMNLLLPSIEQKETYAFGQEHPFLASLSSVPTSLASGIEFVVDALKYVGDSFSDPYSAKLDKNSLAETTSTLRQGVSDTVDWNIGGWDAFDFIYNTGMSGVDSAVASFIPGGYMLLGLSAAANGVNDGLERGMSDGQALANGVFSGIFEAVFEKISIGNLDSMKSLTPKTLKQFGKEMVKSMGVNAKEEALTEIANITYDIIANGELSQLQQLVGSGKSYLEAIGELGLQVLESGASGALMGFGFSGAASGVNAAVNTFKQNKIGKGIVADGKAQDYISRGLELPDTKAFKYAEAAKAKLDKGKKANVRLGKLAQNLSDSQMISSFRSQLGEKSGDIAETLTDLVKGREVSNKAIRSILQNETALSMLNESFGTSFTADSKVEDVNEGIKKGFETPKTERDKIVDTLKKNVDSKGVNAYADTIEALQRGEVVSDKEINAFLKNPQALAALNEITGETFTKKTTTNTVRKAMVKDNMSRPGQALMFGTTLDIGENGLKGLVSVANHSSGSMANIAQAYNAIYQAAKQGKAITDAKNPYLSELNAAQKLMAYESGVMDSLEKKAEEEKVSPEFLDEAKVKAAQSKVDEAKTTEGAKKKGSVVYSGDRGKLSDLQKKSLEVLEKISTSLGVTFHMYESKKVNGRFVYEKPDGVRTSANGWYDTKTGEIWLDINAGLNGEGTIIFTAAHELTHFIKQWSPAKFKIFADFLIEQYNERGFSVDSLVQDQIDKAKRNGREISRDEAYEEVIADSCESFLRDSNAAEKIAALNEKDAGLVQKIKQFISNLLKRLRELMSGMKPDSFEGKLVSEMTASIEQLHKLWIDALADAGEAYSTLADIDIESESVAPMFSERTWTESEYVTAREETAKKISEAVGVDMKTAYKYIDDVNSIAKMIADDRARLDYEASSFGSAFVSNVEYGGSFDYTTLCKKRRIYTGTFSEIQKRLKEVALTPDDILKIRNMLIEEGVEATCGLCYVEGSRANMGKFAKQFIELYKRDNPDAWIPNMADVNTPDGVEQMRINHPEAYESYEYFWNHYGKLKDSDKALFASQQKPKLYEARKEYKGEILKHFKGETSIDKKNRNGGIRMQSFSDFEIVHLIDTMQVIMDMSTVGLAGQAYTKVPEFAKAFGNTGLKINLSLIAKGVDADGNLILDDREGMPHETAFALREKYSKNVGTIIVTFTDEQLLAAMADPRIDFIIPFHRSQWKKGQYGAMGLPKGTKDYTFMQNEKLIKQTYHEYQGRMVKDKASNYMPNKYWKFSKSGKENAEAYLKMCAENNKRPKFYKLLDYDGNGTYSLKKDGSTDGYWKLLIDFKMYDNDGIGSPQMAVTPTFNMDEARTMLDEYKGGHSSYPVAHSVVDRFVEEYNNDSEVKYSERDPDALTNREILANMLDSVAESDRDKAFLDKYKARLAQIDEDTAEIARLKEEKKGAEKLRREVIASKIEKLENGITESEKWLKNLEDTATLKRLVNKERDAMYAEAVLAGQMAQGKADAKVIRKQQEKLDKEKQKRADMRSDMQQQAKESKSEAVAREKQKRADMQQKAKQSKSEAVARERQKRADMLAEYRERVAEREQRIKDKYQEARERSIEGRNKTKIRNKINGVVSTLHKLLTSDSKEKHVPSGLRAVVADALSMINMDTVDAEKRIKIYNERIAKAEDPVVKEALTHKRDEIEAQGVRFAEKIAKLQDAYAQIKKDSSADVRSIYSEDIEEYIKTVREQVGDTSIKDMDIDQLEAVYEMFKIILKNVRDGNKLRLEDIKKTIAENSMAVSLELAEDGKNNKALTKVGKMLKKFGWSLLKPGTAMKVIGSKTLAKLYENIRKGEDTWAVDAEEAATFFEKIRNKYKFDSWNLEKKHDFTDDVGNKFSLTVEQIMSLYAYSKRDKADLHLEKGGFVFDSNITVKKKNKLGIPVEYYVNDTNPYRLNKAKVAEISSTLTKEQIDFVDEMQAYLSDVMGKKGNEVSMKMYDVRLFKEKYYFPLKTSKYFREFNPEKGSTPKIKNSGFTHKTLPGASNPIVLSNFMDVWTGHINDMAMYHAFTLPVEDFMKVYNYNSREDGFSAIKQKISEHYGDEANNYIQTLIDQLNGGARSDPDADMLSRGIAKFKKAKTFVSASVVIQQLSALARAWAYIDPKYFVGKPQATSHDKTWAEVKKYAPVAIIKEMGRFDANMGRSTADYIMKRSYDTIKDKAKGVFTDKEYRDDILSKAPALADELAWCAIWKAVKREVAATTDLEVNSAEYFERCGERFTEIIENTQVYDSVLSKSEIMRSKDSGLKMVTAFASEPLTTVNMMVDAVIEGGRGRKNFARKTLGAVVASVVLNSILVSIVYAARDDDEDETYSEKYLASLTSELIDGFNPLTYIPFVRDVWSAMQGYDIERTDMSMFGDLWKSVEGLFSTSKGGFDKVSDFVGNVAALFGIPADNIMRDARAIYNVGDLIYNKFANDLSTTKWGVRDAVAESAKNVVPLWNKIETLTGNKRTKYDELYEALVSGDETYIKRAKSHFTPEALESGIKRGLRDNDIRVKEAAEAYLAGNVRRFGEIIDTIAAEGVFEAELIESTVRSEINRLKPDEEKEETVEVATSIYKSSDINVAFDSGDNEQALEVLAELIEVKTINNVEKLRKEAEKKGKTISEIELLANAEFDALSSIRSSITSYWKPRYILASEDGNSEEMDRIYNILLSTDLYGKWNKLEKTLRNWLEE